MSLADEFKTNALLAIYDTGSFTADGIKYNVISDDDGLVIRTSDGADFAAVSSFVVRRYNGEDSQDTDFKAKVREVVMDMEEKGLSTMTFRYSLPQ